MVSVPCITGTDPIPIALVSASIPILVSVSVHLYIQMQKKVKSNPKQPSCKKKSVALKNAMVKKDVKSKVAAKKWL